MNFKHGLILSGLLYACYSIGKRIGGYDCVAQTFKDNPNIKELSYKPWKSKNIKVTVNRSTEDEEES